MADLGGGRCGRIDDSRTKPADSTTEGKDRGGGFRLWGTSGRRQYERNGTRVSDIPVCHKRLEAGKASAAIWSAVNGASILRVHDVRETVRAIKIAASILSGYKYS